MVQVRANIARGRNVDHQEYPIGPERVGYTLQNLSRLSLIVDGVERGYEIKGGHAVECRNILDLEAYVGEAKLAGFAPCCRIGSAEKS